MLVLEDQTGSNSDAVRICVRQLATLVIDRSSESKPFLEQVCSRAFHDEAAAPQVKAIPRSAGTKRPNTTSVESACWFRYFGKALTTFKPELCLIAVPGAFKLFRLVNCEGRTLLLASGSTRPLLSALLAAGTGTACEWKAGLFLLCFLWRGAPLWPDSLLQSQPGTGAYRMLVGLQARCEGQSSSGAQ